LNITNPLNKYTINGCRLISKETKQLGLSTLKIDDISSARTLDTIELENNFGKTKTQINIYKDYLGRVVKRTMTKTEGNTEIERKEGIYNHYRTGREREYYTKKLINKFKYGKNVQTIHEGMNVFIDENQEKAVGHVKLKMNQLKSNRKEYQVFEELHTNKRRDYIETTAIRDKEGNLTNKTINSNISTENIKDNPFLYISNYNNKDFVISTVHSAKKECKIPNRDIEVNFQRLEAFTGYSSSVEPRIVIDPYNDKRNLANTIYHEVQHQYQDDLKHKLGFFNYIFGRKSTKLNEQDNILARKYWHAHIFYCPPSVSEKSYKNNFLEIDADKYGKLGESQYINHIKNMSAKLPNIEKRIFNCSYNKAD
jgi:hypothetical protein